MKIFVLGTSNSVKRNNYVDALRHKHEVVNLSVGRTPVIMHIKTILDRHAEIETGDLLIIEHYINDMMHYAHQYQDSYRLYIEDLYKIASSLNIKVINLLFPILGYKSNPNFKYYQYILKLSNQYQITLINLNEVNYRDSDYDDYTHIKLEHSYQFGEWLCHELTQINLIKPQLGHIIESPYTVFKIQNLNVDRPIRHFCNSLVHIKFIRIQEKLEIAAHDLGQLIAFGYFRTEDSCDGMLINSKPIVSSSNGYFVDLFDEPFPACSVITIEPLEIQGGFYSPNKFEYVEGKFEGTKLVELIFRKSTELRVMPAKQHQLELYYPLITQSD